MLRAQESAFFTNILDDSSVLLYPSYTERTKLLTFQGPNLANIVAVIGEDEDAESDILRQVLVLFLLLCC